MPEQKKNKKIGIFVNNDLLSNPFSALITHLICNNQTPLPRTKDLESMVKQADILVVGIGIPEKVRGSWIKPGSVVIDCGINSIDDSSRKNGYRLVGDVAYKVRIREHPCIT